MNAKNNAKPVKVKALIVGADLLKKESTALVKAIGNMDARIGLYLLSEIADIEKHRNTTRLNAYFDAIKGKGTRTHAQHAYIQAFGNVRFDEDAKKYVMLAKRSQRDADRALNAARAANWTTYKAEGQVKQFDLDRSLSRVLYDAFVAGYSVEEIEAHIAILRIEAQKKAADALKKAGAKVEGVPAA